MWAGRDLGTRWTTHNIAAIHNRLLAPEMSAWSFNEALANGTAEVTYNRPFSGCIPVENQSVYGKPAAWCQTTSYTSLHTLGDGQFVITCE